MMIGFCKLCEYADDVDYLHPIYDGLGGSCVAICEICRDKIFSDPERSKREDLPNLIYKPSESNDPPLEATCTYSEAMNHHWDKMRCSEHCGNTVREVQ